MGGGKPGTVPVSCKLFSGDDNFSPPLTPLFGTVARTQRVLYVPNFGTLALVR